MLITRSLDADSSRWAAARWGVEASVSQTAFVGWRAARRQCLMCRIERLLFHGRQVCGAEMPALLGLPR